MPSGTQGVLAAVARQEPPGLRVGREAASTRVLLWDGVIFEQVGALAESDLRDAFPLEKRPHEISVKKLSDESAKRFRKGRR
jgi:hypothetical protein